MYQIKSSTFFNFFKYFFSSYKSLFLSDHHFSKTVQLIYCLVMCLVKNFVNFKDNTWIPVHDVL